MMAQSSLFVSSKDSQRPTRIVDRRRIFKRLMPVARRRRSSLSLPSFSPRGADAIVRLCAREHVSRFYLAIVRKNCDQKASGEDARHRFDFDG
jgi:hypothetical protein